MYKKRKKLRYLRRLVETLWDFLSSNLCRTFRCLSSFRLRRYTATTSGGRWMKEPRNRKRKRSPSLPTSSRRRWWRHRRYLTWATSGGRWTRAWWSCSEVCWVLSDKMAAEVTWHRSRRTLLPVQARCVYASRCLCCFTLVRIHHWSVISVKIMQLFYFFNYSFHFLLC